MGILSIALGWFYKGKADNGINAIKRPHGFDCDYLMFWL
jgi:hypothetical protein